MGRTGLSNGSSNRQRRHHRAVERELEHATAQAPVRCEIARESGGWSLEGRDVGRDDAAVPCGEEE
jgi:hypothetical protein